MNPKLFISYSWTSPAHEDWVVQLATELREAGIDVILDKWDLREGHDAHAFMERMVSDPDIKKVVLICDRAYAEKADKRAGGVRTEAQIITPEIYASQKQSKFVVAVRECDESGKPYKPVYYKSRIHIDLSDDSKYSVGFEQLMRWIYDEPLHKKPELGAKPTFLVEEGKAVRLATSARFKRAIDLVRAGREIAIPATREYFDVLVPELEKLRVDPTADPFDEAVIESINSFLPYRNELIELFSAAVLYYDTEDMRATIHRLLERLIPYLSKPENVSSYRDEDFDNFHFMVHEIFLYGIAISLKYERLALAEQLLHHEYFVPGSSDYGREAMVPFVIFRKHLRSIDYRNERLKLRRTALRGDMLKERCTGIGIEFRQLMQADFLAYIVSELHYASSSHNKWWPETLVYAFERSGPFEIFARAKSVAYFDRVRGVLGVREKPELAAVVEEIESERRRAPHWNYHTLPVRELLGLNLIGTRT